MFCSSCGVALSQQLKYCNRCGALQTNSQDPDKKSSEKRLDEYLDGLFWVSVLGLGAILGGVVLLKKLNVADGITTAYLILSSAVFLINVGVNLRVVLRMTGGSKKSVTTGMLNQAPVAEISSESSQPVEPVSSVTENTTRELESISRGTL